MEEVHRWTHKYKSREEKDLPSSCAQAIKECEQDTFPNIYTLLQIACTIPVTSCECERSASALRRLKTFMRSSMGQERLASLALMHIHYDQQIDISKSVDLFAERYPRKLELKNLIYN